MGAAYFDLDALRLRVPLSTLNEILDYDGDGNADPDVVDALARDASAYVRRRLGNVYDFALATPPYSDELASLTLDVAQVLISERYPTYKLENGAQVYKRVDKDLEMIRKQVENLGGTAPDAPANVGGAVITNTVHPIHPERPLFQDGVGDY
jgi:hypothetical protein